KRASPPLTVGLTVTSGSPAPSAIPLPANRLPRRISAEHLAKSVGARPIRGAFPVWESGGMSERDSERGTEVGRDLEAARAGAVGGGDAGQGLTAALASALHTPSQLASGNEQTADLERVLDRLSEDYRQVLVLRHREECSFEEIGRRMERSANAARKLWARAVE